MCPGRRTQVVKGAVCKTAMQRFDPARRLQTEFARLGSRMIIQGDGKKPSKAILLPGTGSSLPLKAIRMVMHHMASTAVPFMPSQAQDSPKRERETALRKRRRQPWD